MRIVIVEDHAMFREVVRKACEDSGHCVVGETDSGGEAIGMIFEREPDLVVLDLTLVDIDGFTVAAAIRDSRPSIQIMVLSASITEYTLIRIENLGLQAYIEKNTTTVRVLHEALGALADGKPYFSPLFHAARASRRADSNSFDKLLSEAEEALLPLLGQGLHDGEIGIRLRLSPHTVQTHRSRIMQKLQIEGSAKLVAFAAEQGFTPPRFFNSRVPLHGFTAKSKGERPFPKRTEVTAA